MKFYRHIAFAINHLDRLGADYEIVCGHYVSGARLREIEDQIGAPLPLEYKMYLKELGDGFQFRYYTPRKVIENVIERTSIDWDSQIGKSLLKQLDDPHFNCWGLDDFESSFAQWEDYQYDLREEEIAQYLKHDGEEYLQECRRRKRWLPIFGIGDGGYTLNYDLNSSTGAIRYHDIRRPGQIDSAYIADGLDDWMKNWSLYSFSDPIYSRSQTQGLFNSICYCVNGRFLWEDQNFYPEFKNPESR